MIEIKVKSIWQGKVAIRDKYYWLSKTKKEDILIRMEKEVMEIPYSELENRVVSRSANPVVDKFSENSNEFHFLIYFNWKPTIQQKELF